MGWDNHGGPEDRDCGCCPDAVQGHGAVTELALDTGGAGVQDDRIDSRAAPGDLDDRAYGGIVAADVDGGQVVAGQDKADDLAVDEAIGVTLAVFAAV